MEIFAIIDIEKRLGLIEKDINDIKQRIDTISTATTHSQPSILPCHTGCICGKCKLVQEAVNIKITL